MDTIEKIDCINGILLSVLAQHKLPVGLARGRMGICIYFFESGRHRDNANHTRIAEGMLNEIMNDISASLSCGFDNGLAGIGHGIKYVVRHGYVEGKVNEILSDLDNEIIKKISYPEFFETTGPSELMGLLYYFSGRISDLDSKDEETLYIYKDIIIDLVNRTYSLVANAICQEPLSFTVDYHLPVFLYILSRVLALKFYDYRIIKILDEMTPRLLSVFPYVHANRLFLLWGMEAVNRQIRSEEWESHIGLLKSQTDMNKILQEEMRNQHVYFEDGITSILLMAGTSGIMPCEPRRFLEKLENSEVWDRLKDDPTYFWQHIGLMKGFCGIALTYLKLTACKKIFSKSDAL